MVGDAGFELSDPCRVKPIRKAGEIFRPFPSCVFFYAYGDVLRCADSEYCARFRRLLHNLVHSAHLSCQNLLMWSDVL